MDPDNLLLQPRIAEDENLFDNLYYCPNADRFDDVSEIL